MRLVWLKHCERVREAGTEGAGRCTDKDLWAIVQVCFHAECGWNYSRILSRGGRGSDFGVNCIGKSPSGLHRSGSMSLYLLSSQSRGPRTKLSPLCQ